MAQDNRFVELLNDEGGKPDNMDALLDRIEEKGWKEGKKEGIKEGIDQARKESISNIMKSFKVTAQQAMEALKIPEDDWPKYAQGGFHACTDPAESV